MSERLTADELRHLKSPLIAPDAVAELLAEVQRLRAAIERHKEMSFGTEERMIDDELWEALK